MNIAIDGKADAAITETQLSALDLLLSGTTNELQDHINARENPHEVTADQVGTYTTDEIDAILGNYATVHDLDNVAGQFVDYYDKYELDAMIGDIASALDELHEYAVSLAGGEG